MQRRWARRYVKPIARACKPPCRVIAASPAITSGFGHHQTGAQPRLQEHLLFHLNPNPNLDYRSTFSSTLYLTLTSTTGAPSLQPRLL